VEHELSRFSVEKGNTDAEISGLYIMGIYFKDLKFVRNLRESQITCVL
jgi:hypothetical protein